MTFVRGVDPRDRVVESSEVGRQPLVTHAVPDADADAGDAAGRSVPVVTLG
ncbi:hypothetical protein BH11ACT1_BH11ACT1_05050 [soil metagenome]